MEEAWNWIDLPDEVTGSILSRLSMFDILEGAKNVCSTWHRVCKDPMMWRKIRMEFDTRLQLQKTTGNFTFADEDEERYLLESQNHSTLTDEDGLLFEFQNYYFNSADHLHLLKFRNFNVHKMCRHAVDLSRGNLVDIRIYNCGSDELLEHMTDSSRGIRRLSIVFSNFITVKGLSKVASKLPLLEELEISYTPCSFRRFGIDHYDSEYLEAIGSSCPLLTCLKLNKHSRWGFEGVNNNRDAFAISRTMNGLEKLQVFGNKLDHKGLHAILEGCPRLESLDLRGCIRLDLNREGWGWKSWNPLVEVPYFVDESHFEDLKTRCYELRLTDDSVDDYEYLDLDKIIRI